MLLAGTTAVAAGMVNVASVIAFFAFSSNVTGHVAIFAEEIVKGHWHQVIIVFVWLFMFFFGAFLGNFLIKQLEHKGPYFAHSVPVILEIVILVGMAMYGFFFYQETLLETEIMVAFLLLSMGLQNSLVATISGGVVKTTHLTGLFTDLGMEISQWYHPKVKNTPALAKKLELHLTILIAYMTGGLVGGMLFLYFGFLTFLFAGMSMAVVLWYDITWAHANKLAMNFKQLFSKRSEEASTQKQQVREGKKH